MKFDKEYPATHSMETAWYAADEDGNVALVSYNSNGPVPENLPFACIGELPFGYEDDKDCRYVQVTEEQMEEMSGPILPFPEDNILYGPRIYVKVEKKNRELFEKNMKKVHAWYHLIQSEWGLYEIDYDTLEKYHITKSLIKKNIISKVYTVPDFETIEEDTEDLTPVFTKNFVSCPYYVYAQTYWGHEPLQCVNIPKHPVKLDQFPEKLRELIPSIPIKFKDSKYFRIEDWVSCKRETSLGDSETKDD